MNSHKRSFAALALLAVGTSLAACSAEPIHPEAVFVEPKAVKVEWRVERLAVDFPVGSASPAPGELYQLDRSLATYADDASVRVFIETDPASTGRELASRRYALLQGHLAALGLAAEPVAAGALGEPGSAGPGTANVYVGRYATIAPSCPDWRKPSASDYTNTQSSNFGCATALNFAQMLANPGDLLRGQRMGPADGARAAIAIKDYREGKKPGEQRNGDAAGTTAAGVTTSGGTQ